MSRKLKEATFTIDGRRYHVYGRTIEEAKDKAKIKKALILAGVKAPRGSYTVNEWSRIWIETYKEGNISDRWSDSIRGMIDREISPELGNRQIKDVRPIDIQRTVNGLSGYSESYAKKVLTILRQIFRSALENDIIAKDPTAAVKLPVCKESGTHRPITPFERELTLRTAKKHPKEGLFYLIMLYCGLRPQEAAALRRRDFDGRVLHVTRAVKSDGTIGTTKSKAGRRDVPIPLALLEWIPDIGPDELVCTNTRGEHLIRESMNRQWRRFKRYMEIEGGAELYRNRIVRHILPEDLTSYCYRHTYCTDLQDAGVPITTASRLMGHSSIELTAKIYTHHSEDSFIQAMNMIDALHMYDA